MTVRFTPLGKGSNRRSWHMYAPVSNEFKDKYQNDEFFKETFDRILEDPSVLEYLKGAAFFMESH